MGNNDTLDRNGVCSSVHFPISLQIKEFLPPVAWIPWAHWDLVHLRREFWELDGTQVCMHIYICMCIYICMYIYNIYICMYIYIIIYIYVCMYALSKGHVGMLLSPYFRGACWAICFTYMSALEESPKVTTKHIIPLIYINPLKFIV